MAFVTGMVVVCIRWEVRMREWLVEAPALWGVPRPNWGGWHLGRYIFEDIFRSKL